MIPVKDFLASRIAARAAMAKHLISGANPEAKLLATDACDVALLGLLTIGDRQVTCYQKVILQQMGLSDEAIQKADEIAFLQPALLPFDDAALAVWHWQADNFDGKATVAGVINHLREELGEIEQAYEPYSENDQSVRYRTELAMELADLLVLTLHLCAMCNMDPSAILAEKLHLLRDRDYSGEPDEEGKIKHRKEGEDE